MLYRGFFFILAILGLALVVTLALLGRDLVREGRTGPRWKRKLLAAGMILLGMTGITWDWSRSGTPGGGSLLFRAEFETEIPPELSLEATAQWKHLIRVWHEAEEYAEGKSDGSRSSQRKAGQRLIQALATMTRHVSQLEEAGLLTHSETDLLQHELPLLEMRVRSRCLPHQAETVFAHRASEKDYITCYSPRPLPHPTDESYVRIAYRLPLLEKIARSETIDSRVMARVIEATEHDLAVFAETGIPDSWSAERKATAPLLVRAAKAHLSRIKKVLEGDSGGLQDAKSWQVVVDAWRRAVPLAENRLSTIAQRNVVDGKLDRAKQTVEKLSQAGRLQPQEAELLVLEATRLRETIHDSPPRDHLVMCYDRVGIPLARVSLSRLAQRLPLLERLAAKKAIRAAVVQKVLASVEDDLQMLLVKQAIEQLTSDERDRAQTLRKNAETTITTIKTLLDQPD